MIIVEGPDGVGKTTLCKKLLSFLPTHVYSHFTRLPKEFDYHWGYAARVTPQVVQDRFHMSEIVYSRARGEPPGLDEFGYKLVDARVRLMGGVIVVVTADPALVRARWDPTQMYDLERTVRAAEEYLSLMNDVGSGWVDRDVVIHCHGTKPYVTDHEVREIITLYQSRSLLVRGIARRRPNGL